MRVSVGIAALCGVTIAFGPASYAGAAGNAAKSAPKPAAVAPADHCALSPSLDYSGGDQASCIAVGATLSRVPAVGQTATLKVTVKAARAESDTRVTIDLP